MAKKTIIINIEETKKSVTINVDTKGITHFEEVGVYSHLLTQAKLRLQPKPEEKKTD